MLTLKNSLTKDGLLYFLKDNPSLSSLLLATDHAQDMYEITTIIEPVLQASQRCQNTTFFIQAVSLGNTGFLATNLSPKGRSIHATDITSSWSVGREISCAINIRVKSVSRCHSVIIHHPQAGFLLSDLGSKNGTWVNGERIPVHSRHRLNDGDLLQFGTLKVELFVSHHQVDASNPAHKDCMVTMPG